MFVQGGGVDPGTDLLDAGGSGLFWSSVGRSSSYAYTLAFGSGGVYPSRNYARYVGFSVRCVALGG